MAMAIRFKLSGHLLCVQFKVAMLMKIKRNALCSCQSGKKYKKCCWRRVEEEENRRFEKNLHDKHFIIEFIPEVSDECDRIIEHLDTGNDTASVKADVERLYSQHPNNHEVNFLQGIFCIKENQLTDAIPYFERSVQIFPYFSEAIYNLGGLYRKEIRIPESVARFKRVLEIEDQHSDVSVAARRELDTLESISKEYTGLALDEYVKTNIVFDHAFACLQGKRYEKAILLFQKVLSANPKHVQSYGNIALAYSALGKNKLALECLDKALSIDPDYAPALSNRRMIAQLHEGEKSNAITSWIDYYKGVWRKGKQL